MSTGIQAHAHDFISGITDCHGNRHIGLGTGVGLHINILTAKKLLSTLNGNAFHHIHFATSAIIAFSRITFCIFVGQNRSHSQHSCRGNNVFRRNQFDIVLLSFILLPNPLTNLRILLLNKLHDFLNHSCLLTLLKLPTPLAINIQKSLTVAA